MLALQFHNPLMYNHSAHSTDPDEFLTTFRREKGSEKENRQKYMLVRESSQVTEKQLEELFFLFSTVCSGSIEFSLFTVYFLCSF